MTNLAHLLFITLGRYGGESVMNDNLAHLLFITSH